MPNKTSTLATLAVVALMAVPSVAEAATRIRVQSVIPIKADG